MCQQPGNTEGEENIPHSQSSPEWQHLVALAGKQLSHVTGCADRRFPARPPSSFWQPEGVTGGKGLNWGGQEGGGPWDQRVLRSLGWGNGHFWAVCCYSNPGRR